MEDDGIGLGLSPEEFKSLASSSNKAKGKSSEDTKKATSTSSTAAKSTTSTPKPAAENDSKKKPAQKLDKKEFKKQQREKEKEKENDKKSGNSSNDKKKNKKKKNAKNSKIKIEEIHSSDEEKDLLSEDDDIDSDEFEDDDDDDDDYQRPYSVSDDSDYGSGDEGRIRWDKPKNRRPHMDDDHDDDDDDDGDDSDVNSDGEELGEAAWDRDNEKKKREKQIEESLTGSSAKPKTTSLLSRVLFYFGLVGLLTLMLMLRLPSGGLSSLLSSSSTFFENDAMFAPPNKQKDHYGALQVSRDATPAQIKKAYREAVLKYHPDKNPDCADCAEKFDKVSQAYSVLSDATKKDLYDQVSVSYDVLKSDSYEISSVEVWQEILQHSRSVGDKVWLIQVYTDWLSACKSFSQTWEELRESYGGLIEFGRIHAYHQRAITQTLPFNSKSVKSILPAVFLLVRGEVLPAKTFLDGGSRTKASIKEYLEQHVPHDYVQRIAVTNQGGKHEEITSFVQSNIAPKEVAGTSSVSLLFSSVFEYAQLNSATSKQKYNARDSAQLVFFPAATTPSRSNSRSRGSGNRRASAASAPVELDPHAPSLSLRALSLAYAHAGVNIAQARVPKKIAKDKKKLTSFFSSLSRALRATSNPPTSLPALLYRGGNGEVRWLSSKDQLNRKNMEVLVRREILPGITPHLNARAFRATCQPFFYPSLFQASAPVCVLAIACQGSQKNQSSGSLSELELMTFRNGVHVLQRDNSFRTSTANLPAHSASLNLPPNFNSFVDADRKEIKGASLRFGIVPSTEAELLQLCSASAPGSSLQIISTVQYGSQIATFNEKQHGELRREFPSWLTAILNMAEDAEFRSIGHIPVRAYNPDSISIFLPGLDEVFIPWSIIYTASAISAVIIGLPFLYNNFKTFVWIIFASSVIFPAIEFLSPFLLGMSVYDPDYED